MEPKIEFKYGFSIRGIVNGTAGSGQIAATYTDREPYGFRVMKNPDRIVLYDSNNNRSMILNNPQSISVVKEHADHIVDVYESIEF